MTQPNIVYLHCHDAGRYIQPFGHAIETPNLQRVAEQGVLFRQAFTCNPTCSPSRACLMTGKWAHVNGMLGLAHRGFALNDYNDALVPRLNAAGYETVLSGVQHIARPPFAEVDQIGYTNVLTEDGKAAEASDIAVDYLKNRSDDRPFFLDVGFHQPHRAGESFRHDFDPPDPRYVRPPAPLPDNATTRQDMSVFHASMKTADHGFGKVLDTLDELGLADNTLVICTTDHGIAFPAMKCNLTDHGMGVYLIVHGPGFDGGMVVDEMVTHMDILPTILQTIGADAPAGLNGKALQPLVTGEADELHEQIFAEVNYHAAYEPKRAVRTRRWKYIRHYDGRDNHVYPNCDNSPSKTYWDEYGWRDQPRPEETLYDLIFDPNETNNLAGAPRAADVLADMRARMDKWMAETNDPILAGPIPLPDGGVTTDPDKYSPNGGPPKAAKS